MPIRHGFIASSVALAPTVSLSTATNFNQSIATLNATVSANFYSTTVKFQYSTSAVFTSFTEVNAATTPITGQSVSSYANITGLTVNTTYYFRCVATNAIGTTTSSSLSFVTWSVKTYANATAGSYSLTLQTVTPTGSTAVIPAIHDVFILGGGGGGANQGGGGGGGGYRLVSSRAFTSTSNTVLSLAIGGGGGPATAGGTTTISASNFTSITAGGGGGGVSPPASRTPNGAQSGLNNGGAVGSGDATNAGGTGVTFYSTKTNDLAQWGGGGGGGTNGVGGNGYSSPSNTNSAGGNGGAGRTEYGYSGGTGGGGAGSDITGSQGSPQQYGGGGGGGSSTGSAGLIYFKYYGP